MLASVKTVHFSHPGWQNQHNKQSWLCQSCSFLVCDYCCSPVPERVEKPIGKRWWLVLNNRLSLSLTVSTLSASSRKSCHTTSQKEREKRRNEELPKMSRVWERGREEGTREGVLGREFFPLVPSVKEMGRKNTTPDKWRLIFHTEYRMTENTNKNKTWGMTVMDCRLPLELLIITVYKQQNTLYCSLSLFDLKMNGKVGLLGGRSKHVVWKIWQPPHSCEPHS